MTKLAPDADPGMESKGKTVSGEAAAFAESVAETLADEVTQLDNAMESMTLELEKQQSLSEEYLGRLQRLQADFDNFRKRTVKEKEDLAQYANETLVLILLPVLDNFERALAVSDQTVEDLRTGIEMIFKQFRDALCKAGVEGFDSVGCEFDPSVHNAIMQGASPDHCDGQVCMEFERGYRLRDRVVRPAVVKVTKNES